jgi:hypothetical protein
MATYVAEHGISMAIQQITDPDFQAGFEEAQEPYYADCGIRTDMGLVDVVRSMLTEVAVERGLPAAVTAEHGLYHRDTE